MTTRKFDTHSVGKVLQADYDYVFSLSGECRLCLTQQEIAWILSQVDYAAWQTRWQSPTETEIDLNLITRFQGELVRKLIEICASCEDGDMYLLRQNPDDPCQLEQSIDGGVVWTLAFDYRLCLFDERLNPPIERLNDEELIMEQSIDGGATWHAVPDARTKGALTTSIYLDRDDPACWHTYNAVELIRSLIEDSGDEMIGIIDAIVTNLLIILGAGLPGAIVASVVTGILEAGLADARAQMGADQYDQLRRIIYCASDLPEGWSKDAYDLILLEIHGKFPFAAYVFVTGIMSLFGYVGLNNAGHLNLLSIDPNCDWINCDECFTPFTAGTKTFDLAGVDGWTAPVGESAEAGHINYQYAGFPANEIELILCFDTTFTAGAFHMESTYTGPNTGMKYEVQALDSSDAVIGSHVFFDNVTSAFGWFNDNYNFGGLSGVRKIRVYGQKVIEGQHWEWRNISIVTS